MSKTKTCTKCGVEKKLNTEYFNLSTRKRDGVFRIDLIDGVELVERLKDLRLGVEVETVENVVVDPSWFTSRFS